MISKNLFLFCTILLFLIDDSSVFAGRVVHVSTRGELREKVRMAKPGDLILVDSGVYSGGLWFQGLSGTPEEPIVIRGTDPANPPIIRGGTNGIRLTGCRNLALEDMVFEDCAVHGVQVDYRGEWKTDTVTGISLNRLVIRRIGDLGNEDGIKCTGVWGLSIKDCIVERWGTKGRSIDLVSCRDVFVSRCVFDGANHSRVAFQIKGGSLNAKIDRCYVKNTLERGYQIGGSTDSPYFLPGFEGFEAKNVRLYNSSSEGGECGIAFVNARECSVENCVFLNPMVWCVRILQENARPDALPCGRNVLKNNVFVFDSAKLLNRFDIHEKTDAGSIKAVGNVWYDVRCRLRRLLPTEIQETESLLGIDPLIERDARGNLRAGKSFEDMLEENAVIGLENRSAISITQFAAFCVLCLLAFLPSVARWSKGTQAVFSEYQDFSLLTIWSTFAFLFSLQIFAMWYPFDWELGSLSSLVERWSQGSFRPSRLEAPQSLVMAVWCAVLGFVAMLGLRCQRLVPWYSIVLRFLLLFGLLVALIVIDWCSAGLFGVDRFPARYWTFSQLVGLVVGSCIEFLFGPMVLKLLSVERRRADAVDCALLIAIFVWVVHSFVPFRLQVNPMSIYYKIRSGLIDIDGGNLVRMVPSELFSEVLRCLPLGVFLSRLCLGCVPSNPSLRPALAIGFVVLGLKEVLHLFVAFNGVSVSAILLGLLGVFLGALLNQWLARRFSWWCCATVPESKSGFAIILIIIAVVFVLLVNPDL